jgi:formate dehydrogenase subunit delta
MSHDNRLVYMANQISKFFTSQPNDRAVVEVYNHIVKFWDPRMRTQIITHLGAGGAGLDPVAKAAIVKLAGAQSDPAPSSSDQ